MKEHISDTHPHFLVIRQWDGSRDSLVAHPGAQALIEGMGFTADIFVDLLTKDFPSDAPIHEEPDDQGNKIEDVAVENLSVNDRQLDRLLVTGYPSFAQPISEKMTQFLAGGEVILIQGGVAELTYSESVEDGIVLRENLKSVRVAKGDLILSTDTPNNWSGIEGDKFSFLYFVGNPSGPQRYSDVPKRSVAVQ